MESLKSKEVIVTLEEVNEIHLHNKADGLTDWPRWEAGTEKLDNGWFLSAEHKVPFAPYQKVPANKGYLAERDVTLISGPNGYRIQVNVGDRVYIMLDNPHRSDWVSCYQLIIYNENKRDERWQYVPLHNVIPFGFSGGPREAVSFLELLLDGKVETRHEINERVLREQLALIPKASLEYYSINSDGRTKFPQKLTYLSDGTYKTQYGSIMDAEGVAFMFFHASTTLPKKLAKAGFLTSLGAQSKVYAPWENGVEGKGLSELINSYFGLA